MSSKAEVQRDIDEFLTQEETLNRGARRALLLALFDKHFCLSTSDLMMGPGDLAEIKALAGTAILRASLPVEIGGKAVESSDLRTLAVVEGFVAYMNAANALKRIPKFNYTRGG